MVPIASGLEHPWGVSFRQNGDILLTERDKGTLRVIRNGQLLDQEIPGVPEVYTGVRLAGLMDVAVHPDDDTLVYLTYSKAEERDGRQGREHGEHHQGIRSLLRDGNEGHRCPIIV